MKQHERYIITMMWIVSHSFARETARTVHNYNDVDSVTIICFDACEPLEPNTKIRNSNYFEILKYVEMIMMLK